MRSRYLFGWIVPLLMLVLGGCGPTGLQPGEGYVQVDGGRVWYRIVGSGDATPLLLLHGGPGVPSDYLNPLAALADERPVIFYDQLGCGRSDHIEDTSLMTVDHYVRELAAVRAALGLKQIHLFGHSWGTMLAVDYMLTQPAGVRSLILASPSISAPLWMRDAKKLVATLPEDVQATIAEHEADGTFDAPEYQQAVMTFYEKYLARKQPWTKDMQNSLANMSQAVYGYMWGPSEFTATGILRDYDRTGRLGEIKVPTLFTTGEYDEAIPETVKYYQSLMPGSQLAIIKDSAHLTMDDQPQAYVKVVRDFLHRVEASE